ncbi:MAG: glutathione S-transferase family protein [Caulobacteraceae bacterium]
MLEVYTWEPNANSGKPLLTLKEKGVEFDYHFIDMGKREQHSPEYVAINPNGTVPTVIHDGFKMFESSPAMEYIDEVFDGPSLRPSEPWQRARMRWWMRYIDEYMNPCLAMQAGTMFGRRGPEMSEQELEEAAERVPLPERRKVWRLIMSRQGATDAEVAESQRRVGAAIREFERALGEYPYLAGPTYSLADIDAMTTLHSWPLSREDVSEALTPNLWAWLRRCHARPGIKAAFALGRFIGPRMGEVREKLGLPD